MESALGMALLFGAVIIGIFILFRLVVFIFKQNQQE